LSSTPLLEDIEYWLALARTPAVGPITFTRLLSHFGTPKAVFHASPSEWAALRLKAEAVACLQAPDWAKVETDLAWSTGEANHIITLAHADYPAQLRAIHDPPPLLFVHGDPSLLNRPQIAMVGTRNPSRQGEDIAREFAANLAEAGFVITSGMALGIDAAGHQGALSVSGYTTAVTGTGLDRVYPAQHRELAHHIAERGALVSEFVLGTPSRASNFPRRNRIISGLSLGVLIVEAAIRSGSLITARLASEQGREVFAIPGSIHNPLARGCHALIKEGAKLVETASDIIEELLAHLPTHPIALDTPTKAPSDTQSWQSVPQEELDPDYARLLDYLSSGPAAIDNLVELSGLTAEAVSSMLLILELRGLVAAQSGGLYTRIR